MEALKFSEILSVGWEKFKARPGLCIGVLFIYYAIALAGGLAEVLFKKMFGFEPHIISVLTSAFASFGTTLIILDLIFDRQTGVGRFGDVIEHFPRALGQYLLNVIILIVSFFLLIIPCIIFALGFSMGIYLVLEKKAGIIESFKMSWAMTKGYKWKLFGYFIGFIGVNLVGALCLLLGLLVTIPVTALAMGEIYRRLLKNYEARNTTSIEGTT